MTPIEIPYATGPIRWFMGFVSLSFAGVLLWWLTRKLFTFLRQFRTAKPSIAIIGTIFYAVMFGFVLIPSVIFIELMQNPKTVISDDGISEDATLIHGSTHLGWNEIQKVSCLTSRSGRVTSLTIRSVDGRRVSVGNSGTAVLGPTYDMLRTRLGDGIVERCWIPFRR